MRSVVFQREERERKMEGSLPMGREEVVDEFVPG